MRDPRQNYADASRFFIAVAERIRADQWDAPGLGVWTVRELVGHTGRAFSNVERDLTAFGITVGLEDAADYFEKGLAIPGMAESVAQRGRESAAALGPDPVSSLRALGERADARLNQTPDDIIVATPFGGMRLPVYLPTKTFELIVHTLDIGGAIRHDARGECRCRRAPGARRDPGRSRARRGCGSGRRARRRAGDGPPGSVRRRRTRRARDRPRAAYPAGACSISLRLAACGA